MRGLIHAGAAKHTFLSYPVRTVPTVTESEPTVPVTIRLNRELHNRLLHAAGQHDRTVSAELRYALRLYLKTIEQRASA